MCLFPKGIRPVQHLCVPAMACWHLSGKVRPRSWSGHVHKLVRVNGFLFKILRIIWLTLDPTCVLVGFLYDPPDPYADPGLVMAQEHDVLSGPNELSGPRPDRISYKVSQPLLVTGTRW